MNTLPDTALPADIQTAFKAYETAGRRFTNLGHGIMSTMRG